jgi:peptide subunit release factor 1 (eRF1)
MPQTETPLQTTVSLEDHLSRLVAFESTTLPVISLYLNTQPDNHGRDHFEQFIRKEFAARADTFPAGSVERESFDRDTARIKAYLKDELQPSANGLVLFACAGANDFFEALQLEVPIEENRLYVYNQPHLYHLARLDDEYPRYAAVITDANWARIFVFGLGQTIETEEVKGKKVQRVKVGGWSQARYQRRVGNAHHKHIKEIIDSLDRILREDQAGYIVLAGDAAIIPALRDAMPQHLAEKVVDTLRLDIKASDQEIFEKTLEAMRQQDAKTDAEKVERLLSAFRARGLAVVGPDDTLEALANGQVEELLVSASLEQMHPKEEKVEAVLAPEIPDSTGGTASDEPRAVLLPDLLVTKARQISATVTFIEDAALLAPVGGVGAMLRWR